jgi:hypothetical protein
MPIWSTKHGRVPRNLARRHRFGSFSYIMSNLKVEELPPMNEKQETVLAVHGNADGYWYIGAGRSIAEGPFRHPEQLLSVASDLLAAEPHWRIDVFDVAGNKIISYSSEQLSVGDLDPLRRQHPWSALVSSNSASNASPASSTSH